MYVWARVGMTFEVDEEEFKNNPVATLVAALEKGNCHLDGESYIPPDCGIPGEETVNFEMPYVAIKLNQ